MVPLSARKLFFAALAGVVLGAPLGAFAQSLGSTAPLSLTVTPTYPAPYSQATITPLSATVDLASATFVVTVNGTKVYSGNAQPVAITLGSAGSIANVDATLTSAGTSYDQSVSIQPEDVTIVAEPLSSAPPLYAGKPLVPLGGNVRVVAIANIRGTGGKQIDPTTLSYAWTVDGAELTSISGIGKSVMIVAAPLQYRERTVSVMVSSPDGSLVGGDSLSLAPQEPVVRIYQNDPLLGILFDRALTGSQSISGSELALYGAPYSFSLANGAPILQWFLNGATAQTGSSITLRPTGQGAGTASVSLTGSTGTTAQASENLSLSFGAGASTNLFGL
jgi:hypothetical protein